MSTKKSEVLILYATAHGSTKTVSDIIGDHLKRFPLFNVTVQDIATIKNGQVPPHDKLIVGSAIHSQDWLEDAVKLMTNAKLKPNYTFSVCSVGETTSFVGETMTHMVRNHRSLPKALQHFDAKKHHFFAGSVETKDWGWFGTFFVEITGGTIGNHISRPEIEQWAQQIGEDLAL